MSENNVTPEETTTFVNKITNKVRSLPLKKIAIATAVTAAVVLVVANKDKLCGTSYEIDIDEVTPEGETHTHIAPVNN